VAPARSANVDALISGDRDLTDLPEAEPPIETPRSSRSAWLGYSRISISGVTITGPTPIAPAFVPPRFRLPDDGEAAAEARLIVISELIAGRT
jgi:hypothetical protein